MTIALYLILAVLIGMIAHGIAMIVSLSRLPSAEEINRRVEASKEFQREIEADLRRIRSRR